MKNNLRHLIALLCLFFIATTTFAQTTPTNKKDFVGIWELSMMESNGQPLQNTGPGYLKMFNTDDTFAVVRVQKGGSVITQSGKYSIDNAQSYTERALYKMNDKGDEPLGQPFKLDYEFSEDKKMFTIKFGYKDGATFTEVYRKL